MHLVWHPRSSEMSAALLSVRVGSACNVNSHSLGPVRFRSARLGSAQLAMWMSPCCPPCSACFLSHSFKRTVPLHAGQTLSSVVTDVFSPSSPRWSEADLLITLHVGLHAIISRYVIDYSMTSSVDDVIVSHLTASPQVYFTKTCGRVRRPKKPRVLTLGTW